MKTSYTNVSQIEISVDLGIHEIETIITVLETKAESIRQIRDSLKTYA